MNGKAEDDEDGDNDENDGDGDDGGGRKHQRISKSFTILVQPSITSCG